MKTLISTVLLAGAAALAPAGSALAGTAVVTFVHPENYMDFSGEDNDAGELRKLLSDHVIKQAARMPASQELKVEVLDIDMAGVLKPSFRMRRDIRVINGRADWPTITLRYTLSENGQVLRSGEEKLSDPAYLQRSNRYYPDDPLRYEKKMIDNWLQERLGLAP